MRKDRPKSRVGVIRCKNLEKNIVQVKRIDRIILIKLSRRRGNQYY